MPIPFFDSIERDFSSDSLTAGFSIYHAGGVRKFEHYDDLTQADIRAGLGEYFKVHIKFHSDGRSVQWMDCTCKDNRRRGTKCPHIAALCIHIDTEEQKFLKKRGLTGGVAEEKISQISERLARDSIANLLEGTHEASLAIKHPLRGAATRLDSTESEDPLLSLLAQPTPASDTSLQLPSGLALKKVAYAKDPAVLIATVERSDGTSLKYRLGVEDSLALLAWPCAKPALAERIAKQLEAEISAARVFHVSRTRKNDFAITKKVQFFEGASRQPLQTLDFDAIPKLHMGRSGLYLHKYGFVRFADHFDASRESRWADYPAKAVIDSEIAASLFQSDFERLRQTADVVLDTALENFRVQEEMTLRHIAVAESPDGSFVIESSVAQGPTGPESASGPSMKATLLQIIAARKQGKSFVETEAGWIRIGEGFDWIANKVDNKGVVKLSKLDFIRFRESLARDASVACQGDTVSKLYKGLISQSDIEVPELQNTNLSLRPYQLEGYQWLWWLFENKLGGLLADEMGLGKTHQAMALLSAIASRSGEKRPALVVCPTTVIDHWMDKIQTFAPGLELFSYYGSSRPMIPKKDQFFIVLTSYGILLRDVASLAEREWSTVVLDEAHLVKNQTTRTYQAACRIPSQMRLCLTGTPLENDLFELKTLFDYIVPGYLGPDTAFRKRYIASAESGNNPLSTLELKRLIHPFKLRRTKNEVLQDLPEKVEDIRTCTLGPEQRKLYDQALRLKGEPLLEALNSADGPVPYVHVFAVITFLKQICDDPGLVHPEYEGVPSAKLELLDEILGEALESDQKVVIFSQYARMVQRLSTHLERNGIKHVSLTGQSTKRGEIISTFQTNPDIKVFIGSLLAGGTGIDLTAASVVIHFDRWWNPAKENQATDRIHRIGQEKNVQVFKLITKQTLEEHIDTIIENKRRTFETYVEDDPQAFKNLTREELVRLLTPALPGEAQTTRSQTPTGQGQQQEPSSPTPVHGAQKNGSSSQGSESFDFMTVEDDLEADDR